MTGTREKSICQRSCFLLRKADCPTVSPTLSRRQLEDAPRVSESNPEPATLMDPLIAKVLASLADVTEASTSCAVPIPRGRHLRRRDLRVGVSWPSSLRCRPTASYSRRWPRASAASPHRRPCRPSRSCHRRSWLRSTALSARAVVVTAFGAIRATGRPLVAEWSVVFQRLTDAGDVGAIELFVVDRGVLKAWVAVVRRRDAGHQWGTSSSRSAS